MHPTRPAQSSAHEPSDEELVQRLKAGDGLAFGLLVKRFERPLYAFLVRMVKDRHAAEDLFQETFVKIMKGISGFQDGRPLKPWVFTIALNLARNLFRKRDRRGSMYSLDAAGGAGDGGDQSLAAALAAAGETPLTAAERQEASQRVREAVDQLPGVGREALVLFYFQGLRQEEISQVLDVPVGTVKSRIHNAMARLLQSLSQIKEVSS